jgi:SAM-dependent methyltransferase
VADRETRRLPFGSVAADYDRYRPSPPRQALDWLIPPGATEVLDLAAGTGTATRELLGRVARVVAVEPDARMRAVLAANCPGAEVLDGQGEDIPLPDAAVDAVLIAAAWHWLDPARAVPEITRVLRAGGTLRVIWTSRDDRVPWVAEFNALARESREADRRRRGSSGRRREVTFPPGTPMSPPRGTGSDVFVADELAGSGQPARHLQRGDHARPAAAGRFLPAGAGLPRPAVLGRGGPADDLPVPAQRAPARLVPQAAVDEAD